MPRFLSSLLLLLVALANAGLLEAQPERPLLMEGKQSLFQRVLAKPGSEQSADLGAPSFNTVTPFTVFYVYARERSGDTSWIKVGLDSHGSIAGWLPESQTIEWNQGLTVAFRDPVDRDRVLLFRDRESIKKIAEQQDLKTYDRLYQEAQSGELPPDSPVVAIQPSAHVDILRDFYLVPIRRYEDVYIGGERARMLEVSTVPLETAPPPGDRPKRHYRSGIVFVIDSTLSMEPYIQRTREAVRRIYDTLDQAELAGDVSFGLVAFRDNLGGAEGLEYLTRTFATLSDGRDSRTFFGRVNQLRAARVSSADFDEDAYAGIKQAIDEIDWEDHDARYIVLITDAGARPAHDPLASTGLSADGLRALAQHKGIAISVLHLLTPAGASNHASAEAQYRELSHFPGIGDFYYGVKTGEVGQFGRVLDALARQITDQVRDAANGVPPARVAAEQAGQGAAAPDLALAALQSKVAKLGYALRMRYLQAHDGAAIPQVFNAWLLDRDFHDPRREVLDVRVLLNRDQLSDLHYVMRQVLRTAEEGLLSPRNFLNDLKSLAVTIARDPERLGGATQSTGGSGNLTDMGFMREYMEGLPYTGEVMNLSPDDWQDWSAKRQLELIHHLDEKISYYEALHDHTDLWVSLDGGPVDGDSVFPVPLEMLP